MVSLSLHPTEIKKKNDSDYNEIIFYHLDGKKS